MKLTYRGYTYPSNHERRSAVRSPCFCWRCQWARMITTIWNSPHSSSQLSSSGVWTRRSRTRVKDTVLNSLSSLFYLLVSASCSCCCTQDVISDLQKRNSSLTFHSKVTSDYLGDDPKMEEMLRCFGVTEKKKHVAMRFWVYLVLRKAIYCQYFSLL